MAVAIVFLIVSSSERRFGPGGQGFTMRVPDLRLQVWPQFAINWLTPCKILPQNSAAVAAR